LSLPRQKFSIEKIEDQSGENQYCRKRLVKQIKKSGRKTLNVGCSKNNVIWPIFYDYNLTGVAYLETCIPMVGNNLLHNFQEIGRFYLDAGRRGAPPHDFNAVRKHLNNTFSFG